MSASWSTSAAKPGDDSPKAEAKARDFGQEIIRQFTQDVQIWQHQRYSDPPALAGAEQKGFTAIRKWANPVLSRRSRRQRRRTASGIRERSNRMSPTHKPIRVFQVATGNVGSEMIKRIADAARSGVDRSALLLAGEDRQGRRRAGRVGAQRSEGDRFDRGDHRGQARCADLSRRLPRRGSVRESP